jgi:hypothetical protein
MGDGEWGMGNEQAGLPGRRFSFPVPHSPFAVDGVLA